MKPLDKDHGNKRRSIRFVGMIILLAGLVFMGIGLIDFFKSFGGYGPPKLFWCLFVGMPLLFVGIVLCGYGFMGSVARYSAGEMAPVAKDTINYMADGTKDSIRTIASAIGEGLSSSGNMQTPESVKIRCSKCNHPADENCKFCPECGAAITKTKPCSACNELNDGDAKFCDNCGKPLT
ncbi:MAG: zinc ribbon domain-containing protein [Kiritimatiellaceae bacterium]|nr:zinc ribbon domain-containing protein [Kiritimatiellaceae bacterium]